VVTQTTYVDHARYAVTDTLLAGSNLITVSATAAITDIAAGDEVLVINMDDVDATTHETAVVSQIMGLVITLTTALEHGYDGATDSIVVQRVPNYTQVTVESEGTLTTHAWDGSTGGMVVLRALTLTVESGGELLADGLGYANQNGPGGGSTRQGGTYSGQGYENPKELYGSIYQPLNLGSGGGDSPGLFGPGAVGGDGGGQVRVIANTVVISGVLSADGNDGGPPQWTDAGGAGGGSSGSIWLVTDLLQGPGTNSS
jgi:hypothetical protein